jgi:DNA-binding GntR family transcriptional regulator
MTVAAFDQKITVETIQTEILRRICFLDYLPGDQLKEAELASEFGVSRTPIRDAINRISHLDLVETRNGVGSMVVALPAEKICHVYDMRLELATSIAALSPQPITEADKVAGRALLEASKNLESRFDRREYVEINHQLNSLIAGLIGNSLLQSFWWQTYYQAASTWSRVSDLLGKDVASALVRELSEINLALEENDVRAIGFIQRVYIGYGYQRIKKHLLGPESKTAVQGKREKKPEQKQPSK